MSSSIPKWFSRWFAENLAWDALSTYFKIGLLLDLLTTAWAWVVELSPLAIWLIAVFSLPFISFGLFGLRLAIRVSSRQSLSSATHEEEADIDPLRFGSPIDPTREAYLTWWHIPIRVSRTLERCEAQLFGTGIAEPPDGPGINLRWSSRDGPQSQLTLDPGREYRIPVVVRSEQHSDRSVFVCNDEFFRPATQGETIVKIMRPDTTGQYQVRVRWAGGEQWSPRYEILAPSQETSNGKFHMRRLND
jgi:hypothetical protein